MKFGQQLELNTFPQWSRYYVRYRQIKNYINQLFPSAAELAQEAREDQSKAQAALSMLTDKEATQQSQAEAEKAADAHAKHTMQLDSDGEEEPLLSPSPSPDPSLSPNSAASPSSERLAINTISSDYGGLGDDPMLAERKGAGAAAAAARVEVQLNDVKITVTPSNGASNGTSADGAQQALLVDSPVRANPHMGRPLEHRHALARQATIASLRSETSVSAYEAKVDEIVVKILAELQKVDEFHRVLENKILATFESLQSQVAAVQHAREEQPKQQGIMKRLKELQKQRAAHKAGLQMEEKEPATNGHGLSHPPPDRSASASPAPSSASEHHHSHHPSFADKDDEIDAIPLRAAMIQLHRRATMLIHFVDINYVAFLKLLKVFDKRTLKALRPLEGDAQYADLEARMARTKKQLSAAVQNRHFYTSRTLDNTVVPEIYRLYADLFEHGNVEKSKLALLSTMTEQTYNRSDSFWLGIKMGVILMLLGLLGVILVRPVEDMALVQEMTIFSPIYRCIGLLISFVWFWSLLVWIWDAYRIPYVLIFELNPRTRLTHFQIQNEAANLTIVYLFNSLLFLTHSAQTLGGTLSLAMYPLAMFLYILFKFFTPSRNLANWQSRMWLLGTLAQVLIAPFGKIRFTEGFVGDILTSMVKIFVDVEASFCILLTWFVMPHVTSVPECATVARIVVPILCALPLWWRFLQCLRRYYDTRQRYPHLPNAVKYLITHSVVIMAAYHPMFNNHQTTTWQTYRIVWVVCTVFSTLYQIFWDTVMDWGLRNDHPQYWGLRKDLAFADHVWFYYFAVVSNFFLRWVWVITIIPFSFEEGSKDDWEPTSTFAALISYDQIIVPILGLLELYRRFQWSIIRVEYEQLSQGALLRVDSHLPVFIQSQAKSTKEQKKEDGDKGYGIFSEVVGMVILLLLIAVIAALS